MTLWRPSATAVMASILCAGLAGAAEFSSYRGFKFGMTLANAAEQAKAEPDQANLIHKRPAVIQELEWRPQYYAGATQGDSVRYLLLRFYNGELFQIVSTYDRDKVEGMTEADMVKAISQTYGTATTPAVQIPYHSNYGEVASVLARWENPEYSYDLVRTGDLTSYALIANCKRLNPLAEGAIAEAVRLDALEAPQRAIDLQKKLEAADQLVLDKARSTNMPNFRP